MTIWIQHALDGLARGETVSIRPHGGSMRPKIESGELVQLEPVDPDDVSVGDIVLVKVRGTIYLHLVKAAESHRVLIGNNHGGINGWTPRRKVYGRVVASRR